MAIVPLKLLVRPNLNQKIKVVSRIILFLSFCLAGIVVNAQQVDSIYFHLYTDSLKKGTHNYINVDGKLADGKWVPLSAKEIRFTASDCHFSGNELVIPADFRGEKVTVKAVLKADSSKSIERTIWIKTRPDGPLPTQEEILKKYRKKTGRKNRN